jgi:hypothetical protein
MAVVNHIAVGSPGSLNRTQSGHNSQRQWNVREPPYIYACSRPYNAQRSQTDSLMKLMSDYNIDSGLVEGAGTRRA